jgi:hypothetical protein
MTDSMPRGETRELEPHHLIAQPSGNEFRKGAICAHTPIAEAARNSDRDVEWITWNLKKHYSKRIWCIV